MNTLIRLMRTLVVSGVTACLYVGEPDCNERQEAFKGQGRAESRAEAST